MRGHGHVALHFLQLILEETGQRVEFRGESFIETGYQCLGEEAIKEQAEADEQQRHAGQVESREAEAEASGDSSHRPLQGPR
jgi:hypothetical protein